jgi:branched-chain amino acid transport system permease protein
MFYREAGDFKTSYKSDQETFPLKLDKILFWLAMAVAAFVIPLFLNEYWEKAIF